MTHKVIMPCSLFLFLAILIVPYTALSEEPMFLRDEKILSVPMDKDHPEETVVQIHFEVISKVTQLSKGDYLYHYEWRDLEARDRRPFQTTTSLGFFYDLFMSFMPRFALGYVANHLAIISPEGPVKTPRTILIFDKDGEEVATIEINVLAPREESPSFPTNNRHP